MEFSEPLSRQSPSAGLPPRHGRRRPPPEWTFQLKSMAELNPDAYTKVRAAMAVDCPANRLWLNVREDAMKCPIPGYTNIMIMPEMAFAYWVQENYAHLLWNKLGIPDPISKATHHEDAGRPSAALRADDDTMKGEHPKMEDSMAAEDEDILVGTKARINDTTAQERLFGRLENCNREKLEGEKREEDFTVAGAGERAATEGEHPVCKPMLYPANNGNPPPGEVKFLLRRIREAVDRYWPNPTTVWKDHSGSAEFKLKVERCIEDVQSHWLDGVGLRRSWVKKRVVRQMQEAFNELWASEKHPLTRRRRVKRQMKKARTVSGEYALPLNMKPEVFAIALDAAKADPESKTGRRRRQAEKAWTSKHRNKYANAWGQGGFTNTYANFVEDLGRAPTEEEAIEGFKIGGGKLLARLGGRKEQRRRPRVSVTEPTSSSRGPTQTIPSGAPAHSPNAESEGILHGIVPESSQAREGVTNTANADLDPINMENSEALDVDSDETRISAEEVLVYTTAVADSQHTNTSRSSHPIHRGRNPVCGGSRIVRPVQNIQPSPRNPQTEPQYQNVSGGQTPRTSLRTNMVNLQNNVSFPPTPNLQHSSMPTNNIGEANKRGKQQCMRDPILYTSCNIGGISRLGEWDEEEQEPISINEIQGVTRQRARDPVAGPVVHNDLLDSTRDDFTGSDGPRAVYQVSGRRNPPNMPPTQESQNEMDHKRESLCAPMEDTNASRLNLPQHGHRAPANTLDTQEFLIEHPELDVYLNGEFSQTREAWRSPRGDLSDQGKTTMIQKRGRGRPRKSASANIPKSRRRGSRNDTCAASTGGISTRRSGNSIPS